MRLNLPLFILAIALLFSLSHCSPETQVNEVVEVDVDTTIKKEVAMQKGVEAFNFEELGYASYYGPGFHGRLTANGETFDQHAMTAAHKMLPFGTKVKVTNEDTGKTIYVTINDRGPYTHNRIIDLSVEAARQLDIMDIGTAKVKIEALIDTNKARGIANKVEQIKENTPLYN